MKQLNQSKGQFTHTSIKTIRHTSACKTKDHYDKLFYFKNKIPQDSPFNCKCKSKCVSSIPEGFIFVLCVLTPSLNDTYLFFHILNTNLSPHAKEQE